MKEVDPLLKSLGEVGRELNRSPELDDAFEGLTPSVADESDDLPKEVLEDIEKSPELDEEALARITDKVIEAQREARENEGTGTAEPDAEPQREQDEWGQAKRAGLIVLLVALLVYAVWPRPKRPIPEFSPYNKLVVSVTAGGTRIVRRPRQPMSVDLAPRGDGRTELTVQAYARVPSGWVPVATTFEQDLEAGDGGIRVHFLDAEPLASVDTVVLLLMRPGTSVSEPDDCSLPSCRRLSVSVERRD